MRYVRRVFLLACFGSAVALAAPGAAAQPVFQSGSGGVTLYQRFDRSGQQRTPVAPNLNPFPLPSYGASVFQLNSTTHPQGNIVAGPLTTIGRAGVGQVTSPNFFGVSFATGTNILQRGNADTSPGAAGTLTIVFDGTWMIGPSPITGVTAGAFTSFLGTLPANAAAFSQINLEADFQWKPPGAATFSALRPPIRASSPAGSASAFFFRRLAGNFAASPSNVVGASPSTLPSGSTVRIFGSVSFLIHNDGGEALSKTDLAIPNPLDFLPPMGIRYRPVAVDPPAEFGLINFDCPGPIITPPFALDGEAVVWRRIDLSQPVTRASGNNLTLATVSLGGTGPAWLGLYNELGGLVAADGVSGEGRRFGQLSFGFGRRPGIGADSADADGRNGELNPGVYYLAIANEGATFGASQFSVTPGPFQEGNAAAVAVQTNLPGCQSPPPIPPTSSAMLGTLAASDARSFDLALDPTGPTWVTFELSEPIAFDRPRGFLTIDTGGTAGPDTVIGLYNAEGEPVSGEWFDDDSYGDGLSQLDFRQAGATVGPIGPAQTPRDGRNGRSLAAGQYYLTVATHRARFGVRKWDVRSDTPSAAVVRVNIRTGDEPTPLVDGYRDESYGPALTVQDAPTAFGDSTLGGGRFANGSELDALYAQIRGETLYLLLTGNLESNFNKLELFFDTGPGGQRVLRSDNAEVDRDGLNRMAGLSFEPGFLPDQYVSVTGGDGGGGEYALFVNYATLPAQGRGVGVFVGGSDGSGAPLTGGDNRLGLSAAINNANTGGVTDGAADPLAAEAVATGVELAIPLAALGQPVERLCVRAFINGREHDFVSNQFLGGLGTATNLGEPREVNLSLFRTACVPVIGRVPVACPADFNGDGFVNPDDLSDYITAYFQSPPDPRTDYNDDGRIDPDDLSDIIVAYFTACG